MDVKYEYGQMRGRYNRLLKQEPITAEQVWSHVARDQAELLLTVMGEAPVLVRVENYLQPEDPESDQGNGIDELWTKEQLADSLTELLGSVGHRDALSRSTSVLHNLTDEITASACTRILSQLKWEKK